MLNTSNIGLISASLFQNYKKVLDNLIKHYALYHIQIAFIMFQTQRVNFKSNVYLFHR